MTTVHEEWPPSHRNHPDYDKRVEPTKEQVLAKEKKAALLLSAYSDEYIDKHMIEVVDYGVTKQPTIVHGRLKLVGKPDDDRKPVVVKVKK